MKRLFDPAMFDPEMFDTADPSSAPATTEADPAAQHVWLTINPVPKEVLEAFADYLDVKVNTR